MGCATCPRTLKSGRGTSAPSPFPRNTACTGRITAAARSPAWNGSSARPPRRRKPHEKGKGQKEIVQALAKIPKDILENVHLDIIGEGIPEYKKEIETLIKENNLEKYINLLPYKNDLRKCLKDYDIGIVCSRAEGFGRITVEYMATQLVVIASDTGANPEIIDDGVNGFLYHYHDIEDLANKIVYIYEHKEMREQIGIKGREKVLENFISDINAKNVFSNYLRIEK